MIIVLFGPDRRLIDRVIMLIWLPGLGSLGRWRLWLGSEFNPVLFEGGAFFGCRFIADLSRSSLAKTWKDYGDELERKMEGMLYSKELNFWIDVVEGTNLRCEGRELIGYFPYRCKSKTNTKFISVLESHFLTLKVDIGTSTRNIEGLAAGLTPEHFLSEFGPPTLEQSNPYFTALKNSTYCCMWQGQSWPFSTSVYLTTLSRIARAGLNDVITPELFSQEFRKYTRTNYKDGVPFTAEAHYPTIDQWSGDTTNHSENYLHSTYIDNVFTDFFGIVPTFGDTLVLQPLVPANWSYFAIENLPYHGTLLTMIWDKSGTHYGNCSAGFSVYSNGSLFHHQRDLKAFNVTLPFKTVEAAQQLAVQPQWQNIMANPNAPWGLTNVTADWTLNPDGDYAPWPAWYLNDGLLWYDELPDNRWTNNQSEIPYSTINITLPRPRKIHSISLGIYVDVQRGGVSACPDGIRVTDSKGETIAFKRPWNDCVPNALNTVPFANPSNITTNKTTPEADYVVETGFLQVTLSDQLRYTTAVSEIQLWVEPSTGPRYEAEDGLIGTFIGSFEGKQTGLNGTVEKGGVTLGSGGWVELADIQRSDSEGGRTPLTVLGSGHGTVEVQMNWLTNHTVSFSGGMTNKTVIVDMLRGGNFVTILQKSGMPWIDAVVVGV